MNRAFIALGSNIDGERNVREAVRRLARFVDVVAASPVYETTPVGATGQANYLNAVLLVRTERSAEQLKHDVLQVVERELGRVRTADKYAPRTIDLDITLFNDQVLDLDGRHIPDPDLLEHPHIAVPLADLSPAQRHPETGQEMLEIARAMSRTGMRRRDDIALRWLDDCRRA